MPDFVVKTTFKGVDNTSAVLAAMERAAANYGGTARASIRGVGREADHASTALRNASKHGYNFGAIVKGILAANAIRGGIGMIGSGVQKAGSDFLHFGDVMTGAVARFREVDTTSSVFGETIDRMGKQVRTSMLGTRYSALDGAKALNVLSMAGYNSEAALKMLPNLAGLATAAGEDFMEAVESSSKILGGFGLRNDDAAKQVANHIKLNDQLAESFLLATGDMHGMLETMKTIAPITKDMGVAQEEALALAVALSNAGIEGDVAATAIKRGMLNVYATSADMQKEFNLNGVFPYDLKTGQARKYTTVIGEIHKALSKLTPAQRNPILREKFGVYGLAGQLKLMQELGKIAEYEEKIKNSRGRVDTTAKAANASPFAKLLMLGNTALEKSFQIFDHYSGKAGGGFEMLSQKIMNFNVAPLVDALNVSGAAAWKFYKIMEPFIPALPYVAGGFIAWKVALEGYNVAMKVFAGFRMAKTIWDIGAALTAGLGPLGAARTAMLALGDAIRIAMAPFIAASPVIATIAGLIGAAAITSNAMRDNGWGDGRTGDQLIDDRNGKPRWKEEYSAIAPNRQETKTGFFGWNGTLTIAGAPAGSSLDTSTGSLPMLVNMGVNK